MTEGELTRRDLLPSLSSLLGVLILFFFALSLTRAFEPQIVSVVSDHRMLGLSHDGILWTHGHSRRRPRHPAAALWSGRRQG